MGFTTGFLGGFTLTTGLLYASIHTHRTNRAHQHALLAQQALLLNSIVEPLPALPERPAYEVRKQGLSEMLKDRWNREVEGAVRGAQKLDWRGVREQAEGIVRRVVG